MKSVSHFLHIVTHFYESCPSFPLYQLGSSALIKQYGVKDLLSLYSQTAGQQPGLYFFKLCPPMEDNEGLKLLKLITTEDI